MSIVKRVLERLRPDSGKSGERKSGNKGKSKVTNKILYQELIEHFESDMEDLSVGRRVLYPMSFNILLHPDDYDRVGESLPFILPEVIAGFYGAIKAKCEEIPNSNGHLTTFDIKKAQQGSSSENLKLSVKCQNSNVNDNNINQEALLGMDILTNNAFTFNFDKSMSEELKDIQSSQRGGENVYATLTYSDGPHNVHLKMLDELVIVSGPKERRNMENILIINNDAVDTGHIQIRYVKETKRFQLCAYSKTRLNMREVPISVGGTPIWKEMPFNSDIFLNDEINIRFKASDSFRLR